MNLRPSWPEAFIIKFRYLAREQQEDRLLESEQLLAGNPNQLLEEKQVQRDPTQREEDTEDLTWNSSGRQVSIACNITHSQQEGGEKF